jgi:hypothetical protein
VVKEIRWCFLHPREKRVPKGNARYSWCCRLASVLVDIKMSRCPSWRDSCSSCIRCSFLYVGSPYCGADSTGLLTRLRLRPTSDRFVPRWRDVCIDGIRPTQLRPITAPQQGSVLRLLQWDAGLQANNRQSSNPSGHTSPNGAPFQTLGGWGFFCRRQTRLDSFGSNSTQSRNLAEGG